MTTNLKEMRTDYLVRTVNKIRHEKEHKREYGTYGTGHYVSASEFWQGKHGALKEELARRKAAGKVHHSAGKPKQHHESSGFGMSGGFGSLFRPPRRKMGFGW